MKRFVPDALIIGAFLSVVAAAVFGGCADLSDDQELQELTPAELQEYWPEAPPWVDSELDPHSIVGDGNVIIEREGRPDVETADGRVDDFVPLPVEALSDCTYGSGEDMQVGTKCKGSQPGGICCGVAGMTNYPFCTVYPRTNRHGVTAILPQCSATPCSGGYYPDGNCDPYDWDSDGDPG